MPDRETSSLRESVAAEIRAQLARRRLSGRQAAGLLGWTSPYLSRRLTGEVPFDVSDLEALAALLDVPVASFLQGPPVPVILGVRRAPIRFLTCGLGGARGRDYSSLGVAVDAAADLTRSVAAGNDPGGSRPARRSGLGLAA